MQSTESPQQRIAGCCLNFGGLSHHDHLPPDLKLRFDAIMTACTREPDPTGSHGTIATTAAIMEAQEASELLGKIHSLYADVIAREQRELIAREILAVRS
jgi:hypothetical protein